jgi:hypothetical protein
MKLGDKKNKSKWNDFSLCVPLFFHRKKIGSWDHYAVYGALETFKPAERFSRRHCVKVAGALQNHTFHLLKLTATRPRTRVFVRWKQHDINIIKPWKYWRLFFHDIPLRSNVSNAKIFFAFRSSSCKRGTLNIYYVQSDIFMSSQSNRCVLIRPLPDLLPNVFCLMVRIFRLMLVLLYTHTHIYIYIYIYKLNSVA